MVIGATGHQHIPATASNYIRAGIDRCVNSSTGPLSGVSSLAIGADQLFAEVVLRHGGRLHAVIPSDRYEDTFDGADLDRYRALLRAATDVETLDFSGPSEEAFLAAGQRVVDLCDLLLAVWDGQGARGRGGTADVVAYARQNGKSVEIIWPEGVRR